MRLIAHISDVHFGREDPAVVAGLLEGLEGASPDVIAVSGDLTQRARLSQFAKARSFLDRLPKKPRIVVPGNHDVSTTNLFERFVRPFSRYHRFITDDMEPFLVDEEMALVGINTVRILSTKDGRINQQQVKGACERLNQIDTKLVRIVVTHHPFDLPMTDKRNALVGRAEMAMPEFAGCKVDLFLSGHLHASQTVATSSRYGTAGFSAIVAQAGTAVSTRTRGEANSWNLIRIEHGTIAVQQMVWEVTVRKFAPGSIETYRRVAHSGWMLEKAD